MNMNYTPTTVLFINKFNADLEKKIIVPLSKIMGPFPPGHFFYTSMYHDSFDSALLKHSFRVFLIKNLYDRLKVTRPDILILEKTIKELSKKQV